MIVDGKHYRTIWEKRIDDKFESFFIIDQTKLPFEFETMEICNYKQGIQAIVDMNLRGAPLIGVAGAYCVCLALAEFGEINNDFIAATNLIKNARPTAVNLSWAVDRVLSAVYSSRDDDKLAVALAEASDIAENDVRNCELIGLNGLTVVRDIYEKKNNQKINILTHCNAGWLATVDWGTALAPIYKAHRAGIDLHVWVDETRPRNQGSKLTAWELAKEGIEHTVIADNTGGHLMQSGQVDLVIVGCDRASIEGDICNKIGTYLKALAAKDNNVPFYAALPASTIDYRLTDAVNNVEIELRSPEEVLYFEGLDDYGRIGKVRIAPEKSNAANYGFDVTPARLVTGIITEKGVCKANSDSLLRMHKELF